MTQLRDGSTTRDPRLDRLVEMDERSRAHRIGAVTPAVVARKSKVWRLERRLMGDQGQEGACTEFGLTHVLATMPVAQALAVLQLIRREHRIYWPAQGQRRPWLPPDWAGDPWPGGSYPGASPRYEGTSELSAIKAAQALGLFESYSWALNFDEALDGVLHVGAANLALNWTHGMMEATPEGLIRDSGPVVGGHDLAWIGVEFGKRIDGRKLDVAVLAQSWGLDYGDRGRVYIALDDLERRLDDDGTCAFLLGERRLPSLA
jgi:hypothetical protein